LEFSCGCLARWTDHGEKTAVLIEHRRLGWFHLHKELALELPAAAGHWHTVTRTQLQAAFSPRCRAPNQ